MYIDVRMSPKSFYCIHTKTFKDSTDVRMSQNHILYTDELINYNLESEGPHTPPLAIWRVLGNSVVASPENAFKYTKSGLLETEKESSITIHSKLKVMET